MDETFYTICVEGERTLRGEWKNKGFVKKEAEKLAIELKKNTYVLEKVLTISPLDINETVDSYESACEYLNIDQDFGFYPSNSKHCKAIEAIYKLFIIAEVWNKADDFMPDFSNSKQYKYYPWFMYVGAITGFVPAIAPYTSFCTNTNIGSRLCFKTSERAEQFGSQFINLWNDFYLSNN
jgi:hypothetical protein